MGGRWRIAAGALFFALSAVYVCVNGYRLFLSARGEEGWLAASGGGVTEVIRVDADGPAAGVLRAGDEMLSVGGRGPLLSSDAVNDAARRVPPGVAYTALVRREGRLLELSLSRRPVPPLELLARYLPRMLTPLSFLLAALAVFLLKPADKEALLLALMLGAFPTLGSAYFAGYAGLTAWLGWTIWAARVVCFAIFAVVFLHFFLLFPVSKGFQSPLLRRAPWLERGVYAALVVLLPFGVLIVTAQAGGLEGAGAGTRRATDVVFVCGMALNITLFAAGLISLVLNYRRAGTAARRKMRVVVAASLLAFVPLFFLLLVETAGLLPLIRPVNRWIDASLNFVLPLVPLSFAYAIARHKVIPVSLIIRRGVRYLLVARGSVVLELLTVGVVMFFLMDWLFSRTTATGRTVGVVSGVVAITVWVLMRALHLRFIAPEIDRRFFRSSYDARQILAELGQTLRTLPRVGEMCALVAARVREALQTENVTVFLRDEAAGDFRAECAARFAAGERQESVGADAQARAVLRLAQDSLTVARLAESGQPLEVDFADPQGWARALLADGDGDAKSDTARDAAIDTAGDAAIDPAGDGAAAGAARGDGAAGDDATRGDATRGGAGESRRREGEVLRAAGSALLYPVATQERLAGIISLGPRLGDLPFSREDTQMLSTVAVQVAFALENARLLERRAEEERLRRELEMATEVQQRIFPERPPATDALDLAGSCTPARGVGGDYYDFLLLGGGRVGLAVADVAGKGMSAALLMSVVQASLRSQAHAAGGDLCGLVASMNVLLHRSSGASSYATFFYAQFDPATHRLTYVNAGHNPPLLVRAGGAGVETLQTGGPVIGLFEHFTFEQETVQLAPGDVLVAFTDGLSEALNPEGEEFGEPRLVSLAGAHARLSAAELHARLSDEVRAFCRDAPQHDDLTLLIAKVR